MRSIYKNQLYVYTLAMKSVKKKNKENNCITVASKRIFKTEVKRST